MRGWLFKLGATVGYLLFTLLVLGALAGLPSLLRPHDSFLLAFLAAGFQPIWKAGVTLRSRAFGMVAGLVVALLMTMGARFLVMLALPVLSKDLAANIIGITAGLAPLLAFFATKETMERLNRP